MHNELFLLNLDREDTKVFEILDLSPKIDVLYADVVFEDTYFSWLEKYLANMKENGVVIIHADWHLVAEWKMYLEKELGLNFINWCISIQEWGGVSKKYFPRKHDDILIYGVSNTWNFFAEKIKVKKVTAGTALDKNGGMKIPCDVFYDLGNFHTMDLERIKQDGKNIQWQKPEKLIERVILPFMPEHGFIVDPMMGSGTTGRVALKNGYSFLGVENNKEVFSLAENSIKKAKKTSWS